MVTETTTVSECTKAIAGLLCTEGLENSGQYGIFMNLIRIEYFSSDLSASIYLITTDLDLFMQGND